MKIIGRKQLSNNEMSFIDRIMNDIYPIDEELYDKCKSLGFKYLQVQYWISKGVCTIAEVMNGNLK